MEEYFYLNLALLRNLIEDQTIRLPPNIDKLNRSSQRTDSKVRVYIMILFHKISTYE